MSDPSPTLRTELRGELGERLRVPALVWLALMVLLAVITAIGALAPAGHWWIAEFFCMVVMVSLIVVVSMEMLRHQPIVRLFSVLGFFWVSILFGMIMVDYLTR
jgi:cytochrome c oxidase subunit 4